MSIRFEGVSFSYFEDGQDTIHDFSAAFDPDRISVLTGVSGCGKSTLLYLAAGLYPRNGGVLRAGKILVEGQDVGALAPAQRCRLVSMMFQNPELQFCMDTVRNELIFCLENLCTPPEQVEREMDRALDFCDISHLKHRTLVSLSGGEKQKVMLACLVLIRPKWLLLDEPFANIDDASAAAIAAKLRRLHRGAGHGHSGGGSPARPLGRYRRHPVLLPGRRHRPGDHGSAPPRPRPAGAGGRHRPGGELRPRPGPRRTGGRGAGAEGSHRAL